MNTSKNRGNLGSVKLVLRCKSDTWSPQWKWQCRPHAGIIKHQLGLQMAHSQQSKIAFSLLCWTKLFSTRTLSWQENKSSWRVHLTLSLCVPSFPVLPSSLLCSVKPVLYSILVLSYPRNPLGQIASRQLLDIRLVSGNCIVQVQHREIAFTTWNSAAGCEPAAPAFSNLFVSFSLLPSIPPQWVLFKASFVSSCTNPKADLALTSHKLTCWVF